MSHQDKKDEGDSVGKAFKNLDKTTLIQEARCFNSTPVNPRKCIHILTKIIYLLNQGETLTREEATNLFFATTKLFQSNDILLRRLLHLCIKELSPIAEDVIIVTSSLTKDMIGKEVLYRASAMRALCTLTDITILQGIERYMKQSILDQNPAVSSAALVSALHLSATYPDLVRRCVPEAQEAITSKNSMVSYHALAVVAGTRWNDRLSTAKLIKKLIHTPNRTPYFLSLVIRYAAKLAEEDQSDAIVYTQFIAACLKHKSEIVVYEAAYALTIISKSPQDLDDAVSALKVMCLSSQAALRLAGVRTLAKMAARHPDTVAKYEQHLRNLISDPNRSIATLAVTTLLATGAENSVDQLIKQISGFLSEIPEEFKIIVIQAIKSLGSKYPHKHQSLMSFLSGMQRDEGGIQYKTAIADAIIEMVEENPDSKEIGLAHLCEFIEDCEHASLSLRILHVLGREGPKTCQPARYIRYIYNRIILESGAVRAAAVSTIARFGATRPELLPNIKVLLARCHFDDDDEVRDRALFFSAILDSGDAQLINDFIIDVKIPNPILLEKVLAEHVASGRSVEEPFDISTVPQEEKPKEQKEAPIEMPTHTQPAVSLEEQYADELKFVSGIFKIGPIFKTCEGIDLTEPETEYRVRCVKHIYAHHVVFQFECLNTLKDQYIEKVDVQLKYRAYKKYSSYFQLLATEPCESLPYNERGSVYCLFAFPENLLDSACPFTPILEFVVHDCGPTCSVADCNNKYADTYPLEEFEIRCADHFIFRAATDWDASWEKAASAVQMCDSFRMSHTDVSVAAIAVCEHLCIPKEAIGGDSMKEIRGSGLWRGEAWVLFKARFVAVQGSVSIQLAVRSTRKDVATFLIAAVS